VRASAFIKSDLVSTAAAVTSGISKERIMSTLQPRSTEELTAAVRRSIHDHWRLFLVEGVILVILGIAAIIVPPIAGLAVTIVLGWLFLLGGAMGLVATFMGRHAPGFWWSLLSAAVALLAGIILLWNPLEGLMTLTYVLIAYFVIDGVFTIALAIEHRRELTGRWEWMVVNGIVDLILAAVIVAGLPGSFAWALGLLLGIDLLFGGASLIAIALDARQTSPRV
jgi:uncharacterized membrane protein HdeD (DUF308 family)